MDYFNDENNKLELSVNAAYSAPEFKLVNGKKWIPYIDSDKTTQYPDKLLFYKNNCKLEKKLIYYCFSVC